MMPLLKNLKWLVKNRPDIDFNDEYWVCPDCRSLVPRGYVHCCGPVAKIIPEKNVKLKDPEFMETK